MKKILLIAATLTVVTAVLSLTTFAGTVVTPPAAVPEPATLALLATGMGAIALVRRFRK